VAAHTIFLLLKMSLFQTIVDSPGHVAWPPASSAHFGLAADGQNCRDFCRSQNLICDFSFFFVANNQSAFSAAGQPCLSRRRESDLHHPSFTVSSKFCMLNCFEGCVLQSNQLLFSCSANPPQQSRRLCPCRDFIPEQTALCKRCLYSQPWKRREN
jgi:alpha-1,3(6)-mannosylglycoprotein beta-1,6-N-acetyl-glucosaminyltransferase